MSTSLASPWNQVVDELEARLELHRAVLAGAPAAPGYEFPDGLGPFPPELLGRARLVVAELARLESEIRERMTELSARLSRPTQPAAVPIYLDARA